MGHASPFDLDQHGNGLLYHTTRSYADERTLEVVEFLLQQGADRSSFFASFVEIYGYQPGNVMICKSLGSYQDEEDECKVLAAVGSKCFGGQNGFDPLDDPETLLAMWDLSGIRYGDAPLNTEYLTDDDMLGLHTLAFEHLKKVFTDLMQVATWCLGEQFDDQVEAKNGFRYKVLQYLCKQGIKQKIFNFTNKADWISGEVACLYEGSPSHLMFNLINCIMREHKLITKRRERLIQRHVKAMLLLLLDSGESPLVTLPMQSPLESRAGRQPVIGMPRCRGRYVRNSNRSFGAVVWRPKCCGRRMAP